MLEPVESSSSCPPIQYGSNHRLSMEDSRILLDIQEEKVHIVGTVMPEGSIRLSITDILVHMFESSDVRYFTNGRLRFGAITYECVCQYALSKGPLMSVYPPEYRFDISFWIPTDKSYHTDTFLQFVYKVSNHLVREVTLLDIFTHPETGLISHCYSLIYQSLDQSLSYNQAYSYYQYLRDHLPSALNVTLR